MRTNRGAALVLGVLLAALVLGLAQLFALRYARGDVYEPASTLRSDPMGARILLEALRRVPGLRVRRHTEPLRHLWDTSDGALFLLGADSRLLEGGPTDDALEVEALVRHGRRVVISLAPETEMPACPVTTTDDRSRSKPEGTPGEKAGPPPIPDREPLPQEPRRVPLSRRLGFRTGFLALPKDDEGETTEDAARRADPAPAGADLPGTLPWRSGTCFEDEGKVWRVIYARGPCAVVIERRLGRGSLVLLGDTFVLSNEALSENPRATLVAWLLGGERTIVFDETHLGVEARPGVAGLMRRYALHGLLAGILLLAGLSLWRSLAPFVPTLEEPAGAPDEVVPGRDAAAGLVTILRRGIPPSDILRVCREEWIRAFRKRRPDLVPAVEASGGGAGDPVEAYRRISHVLKRVEVGHEH